MVQIGNLHLGKTENITTPQISIQEAAYLWDFLVGRYKCLEETKIYLSISKDTDFKVLIETGIVLILEKQVKIIEKEIVKYKIPMPLPSPVSFTYLEDTGIEFRDEFMFQQLFEGCQTFIDFVARISRSMITSDPLRDIFIDFLKQELFMYDQLCKYGKMKGWIQIQPLYHVRV